MGLIKIILLVMLGMILGGCATSFEKKAPCNENGSFCGTKIAINHD